MSQSEAAQYCQQAKDDAELKLIMNILMNKLILAVITISAIAIMSSFLYWYPALAYAQIDITQLTGNEKVEILANDIILIGYPIPDNYYDFKTKPIIKIDGQILDYEYPVDTNDNAVVEDTLVSISMTIKAKVSPIESKVLDVSLYLNPDIIRDNPDGSKTYVNNPDSSIDEIDIGDNRYHNIKSTACVFYH
ncbi:MAG: hypothetical protein WBX01_01620 [Nitrososphaeraceae archaeon]